MYDRYDPYLELLTGCIGPKKLAHLLPGQPSKMHTR